jgi:hypothetical protein
VDWVGLDYIRNAAGGYELVDDFVAEMPGVSVPQEWRRLTRDERMTWLARKKIMRRDMAFVEAWEWWRARRVALIAREIKARLGNPSDRVVARLLIARRHQAVETTVRGEWGANGKRAIAAASAARNGSGITWGARGAAEAY